MEHTALQSDTVLPSDVGKPIVVASHPRSGTHLTLDLLRKQFQECKSSLRLLEPLSHLYLNLDGLTQQDQRYDVEDAVDLLSRAARPTVKTHTLPTLDRFEGEKKEFAQRVLEEGQLLYPLRDCRAVICSMYLWERERHPEYDASLSEYLRNPPNRISQPAERPDHDLNYLQKWARHVRAWRSVSGVLVLRFEDIVKDTRSVLQSIGKRVELDPLCKTPLLPEKRRSTSRWDSYWRRITRNYESTAVVGRRSGDPSSVDWREILSRGDREFIHKEIGGLLKELGYVADDSWVDA